jgi:hypothetical protein
LPAQLQEEEAAVRRLGQKIHKGYFRVSTRKPVSHYQDFAEPVPVGQRKRTRGLVGLTLLEKTTIVHKILVLYEKQADVAREYRITPLVVQALTNRARNNRMYLRELRLAQDV